MIHFLQIRMVKHKKESNILNFRIFLLRKNTWKSSHKQ